MALHRHPSIPVHPGALLRAEMALRFEQAFGIRADAMMPTQPADEPAQARLRGKANRNVGTTCHHPATGGRPAAPRTQNGPAIAGGAVAKRGAQPRRCRDQKRKPPITAIWWRTADTPDEMPWNFTSP